MAEETKVIFNENDFSPMMKHYLQVKRKHEDCIIFYRLGDFYELFLDDAVTMSRELDLTLTYKLCGKNQKAPMCGVPVKAVDVYVQKAIEKGLKIAICEQLTEPKPGQIVDREVVRVITPGTIMEEGILDEGANNYLACIYTSKAGYGISWADITTGEFNVTEFSADEPVDRISDIITMISPAEIICNTNSLDLEEKLSNLERKQLPKFSKYFDTAFDFANSEDLLKKQTNSLSLKAFDLDKKDCSICACGALIHYLLETQKRSLAHLNNIKYVKYSNYMHLDYITRKNLELTTNARDGKKYGSLLWYLDKTKTKMGERLLRKFVEEPLQNIDEIELRQNGVEELYSNIIKREAIGEELSKINDLSKLIAKVCYNSFTPNQCKSIEKSLRCLPRLKMLVSDSKSKVLKYIALNINEHKEVGELIKNAIVEDVPQNAKDGGFIKQGFNEQLDKLRLASSEGKTWILQLQAKEQEITGIKNLKISYNRVFGYFIEVPNSQKDLVPYRFERKQTLANCERYVTPELQEMERQILGSDELALKLEQQIFSEIREKILQYVDSIKETAQVIGYLDVLYSLATVATKENLTKPKMVGSNEPLKIVDGRHPIVEKISKDGFVPNDTLLDKGDNRTMIITGPNMAGKSTYMRQVAVITLMAHIGSFVPAKSAQISVTDRIFTRIGATDDLAYGQSTFMVEMTEVANILRNATPNSLILLDEIGRGTSTFDGLSIAWSVMEYVSKNLVSKTLFSTHYHELTELEGNLTGVKNYRISVKEFNGSIIFLRKIVRGGANKSFGIEVAGLAGLPEIVVTRAREILKTLEDADVNKTAQNFNSENIENISLKRTEREVINVLNDTVTDKLSPFEALSLIYDLKEKLKQ